MTPSSVIPKGVEHNPTDPLEPIFDLDVVAAYLGLTTAEAEALLAAAEGMPA